MKRTLIIIMLLLVCTSASAQLFSKEKIRNQENFDKTFLTWGYFLGFNSYDFKFNYDADQAYQEDILVETSYASMNISIYALNQVYIFPKEIYSMLKAILMEWILIHQT